MTHSRHDLESKLNECLREVAQSVHDFPWSQSGAYAEWLAQTYYFVRHSTNLLALKVAKCSPDHPEKHQNALFHLREESGHDKMLLRDLKTLNRTLSEFPEMLEVSLFYQTQYYWLEQEGPTSFTGYTLMLEGLAAREGAYIAESAVAAHGKQASSFILLHSKADLEHQELQLNEASQGTPHEIECVLKNLKQSAYLYNSMLRNIIQIGASTKTPTQRQAA